MKKQIMFIIMAASLSGCLFNKEEYRRPSSEGMVPVAGRCEGIYRVQPGDNLKIIAERFNCDFMSLARQNHLSEPFHITPGQTLVLSSGGGHEYGSQCQCFNVACRGSACSK